MHDMDIEVRVPNLPMALVSKIAGHISTEPKIIDDEAIFHIYYEGTWPKNFDEKIRNFLYPFMAFADIISQSKGILRLGLFYDLEQTVVFSLVLSAETIELLGRLKLSIDSTSYPCSEEPQVKLK